MSGLHVLGFLQLVQRQRSCGGIETGHEEGGLSLDQEYTCRHGLAGVENLVEGVFWANAADRHVANSENWVPPWSVHHLWRDMCRCWVGNGGRQTTRGRSSLHGKRKEDWAG